MMLSSDTRCVFTRETGMLEKIFHLRSSGVWRIAGRRSLSWARATWSQSGQIWSSRLLTRKLWLTKFRWTLHLTLHFLIDPLNAFKLTTNFRGWLSSSTERLSWHQRCWRTWRTTWRWTPTWRAVIPGSGPNWGKNEKMRLEQLLGNSWELFSLDTLCLTERKYQVLEKKCSGVQWERWVLFTHN